MRIGTNIASLNAIESGSANNKLLTSSLEKLSTGLAINKASDDASGMAIADKLRTQKNSLVQSMSNGNSAVAMIQIADKAMREQSNILDIVKVKLLQASSDTTSDSGRNALAKDINKLLIQFDAIAEQTNYNGIGLLESENGSEVGSLKFQIGETSTDTIELDGNFRSNTSGYATTYTGNTLAKVKLRTEGDGTGLTVGRAQNFLLTMDISLSELNTHRSNLGSVQNQIESSLRNLATATTNISAAESVIRDVDYAKESANFNRLSIIGNGSNYALSQANTRPKDVLTLLQ
jgi:flagellin